MQIRVCFGNRFAIMGQIKLPNCRDHLPIQVRSSTKSWLCLLDPQLYAVDVSESVNLGFSDISSVYHLHAKLKCYFKLKLESGTINAAILV